MVIIMAFNDAVKVFPIVMFVGLFVINSLVIVTSGGRYKNVSIALY